MQKQNLSQEEIELKLKKRNKIIKGILMFLVPVPLLVFIDSHFGYPNQIFYWIFVLASVICTFAGFIIAGMAITGLNSENSVTIIAGKVIDNEDIRNRKNMTLKEKIKAFNIIGLICTIIAVPAFLGIVFLIMKDPLGIYSHFENVARAQLISIFGLVILGNGLYLFFNKK